MKKLLFMLALTLPLPALAAHAQDQRVWELLVVDKDPKGTNVRDAPSGKIRTTIANSGTDALRLVSASGASKGWIKVEANGQNGWMHSSVLGICSSATEDGEPRLHKGPQDDAGFGAPLPYGSLLTPLDMKGTWLKVRYVDAKGKAYEGWLPEQTLSMSEGGLENCALAWKKHE